VSSLLECRTRLSAIGGIEDTGRVSETLQTTVINSARRKITRNNELTYNEATASVTTVAGHSTYGTADGVPARLSKARRLFYLDASGNEVVLHFYPTIERFRAHHPPNEAAGDPTAWTWHNGQLLVGPPESAGRTLYFDHWEVLADLVADVDTDAFLDDWWELVVYTALADDAVLLLFEEDSRFQYYRARADDLLDDLLVQQSQFKQLPERPSSREPGRLD
jgi:hypothetical protein